MSQNTKMNNPDFYVDLGFNPTLPAKKHPNKHCLDLKTKTLCPKHQKEAEKNTQEDVEVKKSVRRRKGMVSIFGKGTLERKLAHHGIKLKVTFRHKRKIHPMTGEEQNDNKFLLSELRYFLKNQLSVIIETFQSKIDSLSKELKEIEEENERLADDQKGLKLTVRNLEDMALRVMKPWVNIMPHSDEMTRVMLLY